MWNISHRLQNVENFTEANKFGVTCSYSHAVVKWWASVCFILTAYLQNHRYTSSNDLSLFVMGGPVLKMVDFSMFSMQIRCKNSLPRCFNKRQLNFFSIIFLFYIYQQCEQKYFCILDFSFIFILILWSNLYLVMPVCLQYFYD